MGTWNHFLFILFLFGLVIIRLREDYRDWAITRVNDRWVAWNEQACITVCYQAMIGVWVKDRQAISVQDFYPIRLNGKALWEEIKKRASFMLPINSIQEEATEERRWDQRSIGRSEPQHFSSHISISLFILLFKNSLRKS